MSGYKKVFNNISWILFCRIAQSAIALIINLISARYLGPSNFGLLSYASSVAAFVAPLAKLGLRHVLVAELVSQPEREGQILGTSLLMSVMSSFLCIIGCAAFVHVANAGETDTLIVCLLYSISLICEVLEMIQYWFQAKLLSKYMAVTSLVAYLITALYKVFLLATGKSIYWFAVSHALDYFIISTVLLIIYRRLGGQKLSFSASLGKQLFKRSKYYIVSSMMVTIFAQTDKIMIKMMIGNTENGFYATAVSCAGMTAFVFLALIDSFSPVIYESRKKSYRKFEKNVSVLYSIIIYTALIQSTVLTIFAKPIVGLLYGADYTPAASLLQIVTWYTTFSYLGSARGIWVLAENKQKYLWSINLAGALLNVVGNYFLIPILGASGAAIASVVTQFFANVGMCIILKPMRPTAKLMLRALNPLLLINLLARREDPDE